MKQSLIPTEYIIVEANTNSDWDNCDFILIRVTPQWLEDIQRRVKISTELKTEEDFRYISIWDAPVGFFVADEQSSEIIERMKTQGQDWCFVCTDRDEIDRLQKPDSYLEDNSLKVDIYGTAWYTATGEHSGESYFSTSLKVDELLEELKIN